MCPIKERDALLAILRAVEYSETKHVWIIRQMKLIADAYDALGEPCVNTRSKLFNLLIGEADVALSTGKPPKRSTASIPIEMWLALGVALAPGLYKNVCLRLLVTEKEGKTS